MPSLASILLEIRGDGDQARRELEEVSAELAAFGRETADAEADLDTTSAKAALDELKARLDAYSSEDVSADANIKIAGALADIAVLQAELDRIDGEDVTVDVHVRKSLISDIGSLRREVDGLGSSLTGLGGGGGSGGGSLAGAAAGFLDFQDAAGAAKVALVVLAGAIGSALVASLAEAAAGAGALAISLGATLGPAIALVVGAIANFKDGGPIVDKLKSSFKDLSDTFTKSLAPASNLVFRGMTTAIKDLTPIIRGLKPAFTALGGAVGQSFRAIGHAFSSKPWADFFDFITRSTAKLVPPMTHAFIAFATVLRNIAQAAMPFLIHGFQALSGALKGLADSTSNIGDLRRGIAPLIGQLRSWLNLIRAVSGAFIAFVSDAAPAGQRLVNWLAKGADALAAWLKSDEGRKQIAQFFNRVLPIVKQLVPAIAKVALIFAQWLELMAPLITAALMALNKLLDIIIAIDDWLIKIDRAGFGKVFSDIANAVGGLVGGIAGLGGKAISFTLGVVGDVVGQVKAIFTDAKKIASKVINFVLRAPRDVLGVIRDIWATARGVIRKVINFVLKAPRGVLSAVRSIWQTAKGIISNAISFIFHAPRDVIGVARDIWQAVKGIIVQGIDFVLHLPGIGGLVSAAKAIWNAINNALPDISISVHIPTPSIPHISVPHIGLPRLAVPGVGDVAGALASGAAPAVGTDALVAVPAASGATEQHINVITPDGGPPDPMVLGSLIALRLRQRGVR